MYTGIHVKYQLSLCDFNETCIFSTDFRNILKHQISQKKIVQWEPSCSMRMDTDKQTGIRTDMTELIVASRHFVTAPKN